MLDRPPVGHKSGAPVGREGGGMVQRAGVHMDSNDGLAPGEADRFGEQPSAVSLAGQLRDQPDEG